jgi:signal recognition particle GTPase
MTDAEKNDLSLFDAAARERVAAQVGCRVDAVDDCIAKFLWMKNMTRYQQSCG